MTLPDACSMGQIGMEEGRGDGARFIKKNGPLIPLGYRFITMARSLTCGSSHRETSA
jgi:hypothetical protein